MKILSAEFVISAQAPKDFPVDGLPQIAVAGRSNVGKSSLLNFLVQRKSLVKTSQMPGKTRLINFFLVKYGPPAQSFYFVDIPGFGYAKAGRDDKRKMESAIEDFFNRSKSLAGLMYLVDSRLTDSPVDLEAIAWLSEFNFPLLVVVTKGDKLNRELARKAVIEIQKAHDLPQPPLLTSVDKKIGRDEVLEQITLLLNPTQAAETPST